MEVRKGFYDLSVPLANDFVETLNELFNYGYRTVAIDEVFNHKKADKKTNDIFPEPHDLTEVRKQFEGRLQILNRLTIIFADPDIAHDMKISLKLKQYHVIAAAPINEEALQFACSTFAGEIITLNPDDTKFIMASHKFFQMAARRGICFELKYAPAIRDSNQLKDMITAGQNYVSHRKGGIIVISSGAIGRFQVRSPYDIANLALIFGLSEEQGKSAVSHVCRKLLLRAEGRRYGKTVIIGTNVGCKRSVKSSDVDSSDDDDDEDDTSSDDDSMEDNPSKKIKMTVDLNE